MTYKNYNAAWSFECVLPTGVKVKSWFYADTEQKARERITGFFEAKLLKIQEIDNPLLDLFKEKSKENTAKSNPLFKSL
jgi:hypothetical protein